jgi:hypothetical protein
MKGWNFLPENTQPIELLHCVNDPKMVLYQIYVFDADVTSTVVTTIF